MMNRKKFELGTGSIIFLSIVSLIFLGLFSMSQEEHASDTSVSKTEKAQAQEESFIGSSDSDEVAQAFRELNRAQYYTEMFFESETKNIKRYLEGEVSLQTVVMPFEDTSEVFDNMKQKVYDARIASNTKSSDDLLTMINYAIEQHENIMKGLPAYGEVSNMQEKFGHLSSTFDATFFEEMERADLSEDQIDSVRNSVD